MDRLQVEAHVRAARHEPGRRGRQRTEREAGQRGYPQRRPAAAAQVAPRLAQRAHPFLNVGHVAEQGMGILGRHEAAVGALEQFEAEQRLGMAQRLGHRGLRDVERTGGGADRSVDIDGVEDFDMAQVHVAVDPR